jgi:sugar/nucleoside kinase (ribokinase family)
MADFDLCVIGEINPDVVLRGPDLAPDFGQAEKLIEGAALTIGSSSVIMACGAARLGLKVAFVGVVGDDQLGHFMLRAMNVRGVDTSACIVEPQLETGLSVILSQPEDRAILTHLGAIAALRPEWVDREMLRRVRHVHVGSYFLLDALRPGLPALYREARDLGVSTSLDTNWDPSGAWKDGLDELLPLVDLFLPNETEALRIAGCDNLDEALEWLSERISTVAVKLGERGGIAWEGGQRVRAPALPVQVVDTTGAGDSFDAGFLYGYLNGWPLARSLHLACACGSLSTLAPGGTEGQPTLSEALAVWKGAV